MGANTNFQNYLTSTKNNTAYNFSPALNSQIAAQNSAQNAASNTAMTNAVQQNTAKINAAPALEQKQDEFVSSNKETKNTNKNNILLYCLGLIAAGGIGAGLCALILKRRPKNVAADIQSTVNNIKRFKQIDDTLYRGAKPTEAQYKELKKLGIKTVIAFNTEQTIKGGTKLEKDVAKANGIKFIDLSMDCNDLPSDKNVKKFFKTLEDAKKNKEKVYIHCTFGKDRTGLFSAMYKIKYGLADTKQAIYEMISMNHNYEKHPKMIPYLEEGKFLKL